jgi:hypothetical protein
MFLVPVTWPASKGLEAEPSKAALFLGSTRLQISIYGSIYVYLFAAHSQ